MRKIILVLMTFGLSLNAFANENTGWSVTNEVSKAAEQSIKSYFSGRNIKLRETGRFFTPRTFSYDSSLYAYHVSVDVTIQYPNYAEEVPGKCQVLVTQQVANPQKIEAVQSTVMCNL